MPPARKNRPRHTGSKAAFRGRWWLLAFLAFLALLVLWILAPESAQMVMAAYGVLALVIACLYEVIRSGEIFLKGNPILRADQPAQFWFIVGVGLGVPLLVSAFFVIVHFGSLISR